MPLTAQQQGLIDHVFTLHRHAPYNRYICKICGWHFTKGESQTLSDSDNATILKHATRHYQPKKGDAPWPALSSALPTEQQSLSTQESGPTEQEQPPESQSK